MILLNKYGVSFFIAVTSTKIATNTEVRVFWPQERYLSCRKSINRGLLLYTGEIMKMTLMFSSSFCLEVSSYSAS